MGCGDRQNGLLTRAHSVMEAGSIMRGSSYITVDQSQKHDPIRTELDVQAKNAN